MTKNTRKTKALVPVVLPRPTPRRKEWARKITTRWHEAAKAIIDVGQMLIDAKADLPHGQFEAMIDADLPFTSSTAQRLMKIARDAELTNPAHVPLLPPAWGTLYELTKLPPTAKQRAFAEGRIHPNMERRDVARLRREHRRSRKDIGLEITQAERLETTDQFLLGDCVEEIKKLPAGSVDLLCTDPPYLSPQNRPRSRQTGDRLLDRPMQGDDKDAPKLFRRMLQAAAPKLARDAHAYVFCDARSYVAFRPIFEEVFDFHNLLVWHKGESGMGSESFYARNFELIMFGTRKGSRPRPLLGQKHPASVLHFPVDSAYDRDHPTPKPVELLSFLIEQSTGKNDRVLDPFTGSGSTLVAATLTDRRYFGVEIDKDIYEVAYDKLAIIENDREPRAPCRRSA